MINKETVKAKPIRRNSEEFGGTKMFILKGWQVLETPEVIIKGDSQSNWTVKSIKDLFKNKDVKDTDLITIRPTINAYGEFMHMQVKIFRWIEKEKKVTKLKSK